MPTKRLARLTLCAAFSCTAHLCAAQGLQDQVVELEAGNWSNQQKTYMAGSEAPQGSFKIQECLSEAESKLTVAHYVQKFLKNVGPDVTCNISDLSGASGNITADVNCTGSNGTSTQMTLNYKYALKNVAVSGEGWSTYGGQKIPFKVVASSQYIGDCP
jgi:hypothetical protein